MPARRIFRLYLVKPSHYDDDGYVIQWLRSPIPSNSLASVYGLALDCDARRVLGEDWDIVIEAIDETNRRVPVEEMAASVSKADAGVVMLIGVQSNQFPRALDIARPLLAKGVQVAVGGFHVSGVISMLGDDVVGLKEARDMGVSIFAGEAEGRLGEVICDARDGTLKPLYNHMADLPSITNTPVPFMPSEYVLRTANGITSFDAGRGCPYQCSFCTIINVQGRKSRYRSPEDVEIIVRKNLEQGINRFFITDDNFARNKDWEKIIDRMIALREEKGLKFSLVIQVDTLCHKIPHFIEKCARAGVRRVFIGLENINPANLAEAKKRQNKITEYRAMLLAWKAQRVVTYAGYIIGFAADSHDSVMADIDLIKRELPIDILEFFYLTPLPGSEDHQRLTRAGIAMDPDLNKYDLNHVTTGHAKMSAAEWERTYRDAWSRYYDTDHVETVMRRAMAFSLSASNILFLSTWFMGALRIEGVHPLECGALRIKHRRDRRHGLALEPAVLFYPRYWLQTAVKLVRWGALYARFGLRYKKVKRDPARLAYSDLAITPVDDHEEERELFQSVEAQDYLKQRHKVQDAIKGNAAAE